MKKRVLTVMAVLALMGGKAFAYDYQWDMSSLAKNMNKEKTESVLAYDKTDTKKGVLTFVGTNAEASDGGLKLTAGASFAADGTPTKNYLKFDAKEGDKIVVKAKKLVVAGEDATSSTFTVIPAGSVSVNAKVASGAEHVLTLDPATADGEVKVYAEKNVVILSIDVESESYREVKKLYEEAKTTATEQLAYVADYVKTSPEFYSKVTGLINEQNTKIELLLTELDAAMKQNTVEKQKDTFSASLKACGTEVNAVIAKAEQALKDYYYVTGDKTKAGGTISAHYEAAEKRISVAFATNPSKADYDANNAANKYSYIYDFTFDGKGAVTKKTERATGLLTEMETNAKGYFKGIATGDALDALAGFPFTDNGGSYPTAEIEAVYDGVITRADNIIARFVIKKREESRYTKLETEKKSLESYVNDIFKLDGNADYKKFTETYTALQKEWNSSNTYNYSATQLEGSVLVGRITNCETYITNIKNTWMTTAQTELNKDITRIQGKIDEYSYKISTEFESNVEAQKTYQQEFAKLQAELNEIIKANGTLSFNLVEKYTTYDAKLTDIEGKLKNLFEEALGEQTKQISDKNDANLKLLENEINDAKADYSERIAIINNYKRIDGITDDAKGVIDGCLVELSKILSKLDVYYTNASADVTKNSAANKLWDYETASGDVADIVKDINDIILEARGAANEFAYQYLTGKTYTGSTAPNNTWNSKNPGTMPYVNAKLTAIENRIKANGHEDILKAAADALTIVKTGGTDKSGAVLKDKNGYCTEKGYVYNAERFISVTSAVATGNYADASKNLIADNIESPTLLNYMNLAVSEAEAIEVQVNAFTELMKSINSYRIRWTVAKAKAEGDENEASALKLKEVESLIRNVENTLLKDKLAAESKQESYYKVQFADIDKRLWYVEDAAACDAYDKANKTLEFVKTKRDEAIKTVKGLTKAEVVAKYTSELNEINLASFETDIKTAYNNKDVASVFEAIIKDLDAVLVDIEDIVKAAEAADKEVPGDFNGDGEITSADISFMLDAVASGKKEVTEYNVFINNFKNYNKKQ